jgi:hypothetical protein
LPTNVTSNMFKSYSITIRKKRFEKLATVLNSRRSSVWQGRKICDRRPNRRRQSGSRFDTIRFAWIRLNRQASRARLILNVDWNIVWRSRTQRGLSHSARGRAETIRYSHSILALCRSI